jgi:hypothetical protein
MVPVIEITTELWTKRLAAYAAKLKLTLREALNEEWPLFIRKIIDFTPPTTAYGGKGQSAYSIGRHAVARDIEKTMRPFDPTNIRSKSILRIVERGDIAAFNLVASRCASGPLRGAQAIAFDPSVHTSRMNSRGQVPGKGTNRVVLGADAKRLRAYITVRQEAVGTAKDGWGKAYNLVASPDSPPLPDWVARHYETSGAVIDERDAERPSITAINRSPWAGRKDEAARIVGDAQLSRAQAITSKLATKLKLAREGAGFSKAA